jgi:hypothetical protein
MKDGISLGRCPELVGGMPVQSEKKKGRQGSGYMEEQAELDQRVLGDEDFVAKVKRELIKPEREKPLSFRDDQKRIQTIVEARCREGGVQPLELQKGHRRQEVAEVRAKIARQLVNELGVSLMEVARHLGVSASAISKIFGRKNV